MCMPVGPSPISTQGISIAPECPTHPNPFPPPVPEAIVSLGLYTPGPHTVRSPSRLASLTQHDVCEVTPVCHAAEFVPLGC